ncbi:alpha/beta hydrolase fold [Pyrenophora tritici-repentis]|uniref:Alpha/beta hydrolase fold n=1 Tax=Pyrenophora tritici-repentis TaxID=45151 RepID=A0A922NLB0_9PLEO|nr:alpha/beta hydrolase fold [Pyrenophora tritici-repentis]KAI1689063.1 alpha/beta hydrolase fold [Pyrenophora tritici-repentis]
MSSTSAIDIQNAKFNTLGLTKSITAKGKICCYTRSLESSSSKNPILVLIHGYPQSAYMWRHVIPLLPPNAPLFVPDLPGYGASAPIEKNDKLSVGTAALEALKEQVQKADGKDSGNVEVVLIGHDRGARVAHRLSVSGVCGIQILGVCLIDIVPTSTQWQHFASPAAAAKEVTGYFHWPLLANTDLATRMITAFGPSNWCQEMILRWSGENFAGTDNLKADNALKVYGDFFAQEHTLKASCEDYREGATTDVEREERDQKEGTPPYLLSRMTESRRLSTSAASDVKRRGVLVEAAGVPVVLPAQAVEATVENTMCP